MSGGRGTCCSGGGGAGGGGGGALLAPAGKDVLLLGRERGRRPRLECCRGSARPRDDACPLLRPRCRADHDAKASGAPAIKLTENAYRCSTEGSGALDRSGKRRPAEARIGPPLRFSTHATRAPAQHSRPSPCYSLQN